MTSVVSVPMQAATAQILAHTAVVNQPSKLQLTNLLAVNPLQNARIGGYPASVTARIGCPTGNPG
jgi:hypothetical protein